jgi:hypothetical protein
MGCSGTRSLAAQEYYSGAVENPEAAGAGTLFIFDWDDTLFCHFAMDSATDLIHDEAAFTEGALEEACEQQTVLRQLEAFAKSVIEIAMRHGEVCIVTNATRFWVYESARVFYPGLVSVIETLTVVSAREAYEHSYPMKSMEWKRQTFKELVGHWVCTAANNTKLVVLGDSRAEIEAAWALQDMLCIKTIKFKEKPSLADLLGELSKVEQELDGIVRGSDSVQIDLVQEEDRSDSAASPSGTRWGLSKAYLHPQEDSNHAGKYRLQDVTLVQALATPLLFRSFALPSLRALRAAGGKRSYKACVEADDCMHVKLRDRDPCVPVC